MVTSFDVSEEIFSIDMLTALKSSLKHRRKHVLRSLQLVIWRPGVNLLKLQKKNSCVFPQASRIFSEKQCTVMWQALWLSPSPEQARPYVEGSERKLRDVDFLELVPSQGRKSKNSNVNNFLSSCFKF